MSEKQYSFMTDYSKTVEKFTAYVNSAIVELNEQDVKRVEGQLREFGWEKIVRCRDCEYMDSWELAEGKIRYVCTHFDYTDIAPNGFCAWGELRDNNDN